MAVSYPVVEGTGVLEETLIQWISDSLLPYWLQISMVCYRKNVQIDPKSGFTFSLLPKSMFLEYLNVKQCYKHSHGMSSSFFLIFIFVLDRFD